MYYIKYYIKTIQHKSILEDDKLGSQFIVYRIYALEIIISSMSDKQQAWNDIHRMTNDEDNWVRTYSNHSFRRVSIFRFLRQKKMKVIKKNWEAPRVRNCFL
jgi:hypothetical protein